MSVFPKYINVELTNFCNTVCKSCPHDKMVRERGFMSEDTFKIVIDKLSEVSSIENIQLHGHGESFLYKQIDVFANYAKEKCPNKTISVITNGILIKEIPKGFDYILISFNGGNKETYEDMMHLDFEKTIENIRRLKDRNKIVLQMLLCESNKDSLGDFKKLWAGWEYGIQDSYYNWGGRIKHNGIKLLPKRKICYRLYLHMYIQWTGIVSLCTKDYDSTISLGDITVDSVEQIYNSEPIRRKRKEQENGLWRDICSNCTYCMYEGYEVKKEVNNG